MRMWIRRMRRSPIRSRPFGTTFCPSRLRLKTADQHGSKRTSEVVEGVPKKRGVDAPGGPRAAHPDHGVGAAHHASHFLGGCTHLDRRLAGASADANRSGGVLWGE